MTPLQACLVLLAHVLLACALNGTRGEAPAVLSAWGALAALLGFASSLGAALRRRP
ncbi:hypothetical protein [Archangium lansingense]|uniref:Lipoprotein n=1 Tax=Archangium lansingense TaxID=2995310 RepID=A0ABT4AF43_9BACT|nr:hypothetical protein [Archangium lansinium]MCY1080312.1 hypothetical protein [Archangium lansinium]